MSAKTVADLQAMGFTDEQCTKAVQNVGDNLEAACNWIVTHGQKLLEGNSSSAPMEDETADGDEETTDGGETAQSYKCGNCGKLSSTMQFAIAHAERTGHDQIEESTDAVKPITEEERKEKLATLQLKIAEKKKERSVIEQKEVIEREKKRRVDLQAAADAKRLAEEREMLEVVNERKRQKAEDAAAKQRVRDQINRDKERRRQEREGVSAEEVAKPAPTPVVAHKPAPVDHNKARIQIRQIQTVKKCAPLVHEFSGDETLAAVRLYIEMHRSDGGGKNPFYLKTAYPPKTFNEEEMETPLKELGLTPSAVLIMEPKIATVQLD